MTHEGAGGPLETVRARAEAPIADTRNAEGLPGGTHDDGIDARGLVGVPIATPSTPLTREYTHDFQGEQVPRGVQSPLVASWPVGRVIPLGGSTGSTHGDGARGDDARIRVPGPGTVLRRNAAGQVLDYVGNPRPTLETKMLALDARLDAIEAGLAEQRAALAQALETMTTGIAAVANAIGALERLLDIRVRRPSPNDAPCFDLHSGSDR